MCVCVCVCVIGGGKVEVEMDPPIKKNLIWTSWQLVKEEGIEQWPKELSWNLTRGH